MSELRHLEPFELSRRLERCQRRYEIFLRGLESSSVHVDPFMGSEFPGKTHFDWTRQLDVADPLRIPLLRWLHFLIEARIHVPWTAHEAQLLWREPQPVDQPVRGRFSLAEMRAFALSGQQGSPAHWWRVRGRFEATLSAHRVQLLVRQGEVLERLGQDERDDSSQLIAGQGSVGALAEDFLRNTQDSAGSRGATDWAGFVETALARSASGDWPARVTPANLRDLLGERELFRGLTIDPGPLPDALSPMSFVRAAGAVGRCLARELAANDLPFVVAEDPARLAHHAMAELMVLWTTSGAFFRKKLGASLTDVREINRVIEPAVLSHVRLQAARALVRLAVPRGPEALHEEFVRVTRLLCEEEPSPQRALVLFRVADDAPARFVSVLDAAARERELMEEHDEDWYRNPRAGEQLREHLAEPAPRTIEAERLIRGRQLLEDRLQCLS